MFLSNRKNAFRAAWQNEKAYIAAEIGEHSIGAGSMHACIDYDASRSSISTCDDVGMLVDELHAFL